MIATPDNPVFTWQNRKLSNGGSPNDTTGHWVCFYQKTGLFFQVKIWTQRAEKHTIFKEEPILKKAEKFTQVYFNEADPMMEITTHNTDLKRRLRRFAEQYPDLCRITEIDEGRMSVEIDKRRCGFKLTAPYSEKRKRQLRESGKAQGIHTRLNAEGGEAHGWN